MTISKSDYYKLVGLQTLANSYHEKLDDLERAFLEITKENEHQIGSYSSDILFGFKSLNEGLKLMGIEVE